jgi:ribosome-associated heat shock protein Hsp15
LSEASGLRLDKWLWHARFIRSRALAAELVGRRRVRINDHLVAKTHQLVHPGDVITLRLGERLHVVRVRSLGARRGPASDAEALYDELVSEG